MALIAVLDANVLYPAPVRDFILHIAFLSVFQPKWSDQIQEEWIRSLLKNRPDIRRSDLTKTSTWMDMVFPDARTKVDHAQQSNIDIPDKDDIHVVKAALNSGANYIISFNLKDFPKHILKEYGVQAIHPDDFLCGLIDQVPKVVLNAFNNQVSTLKNPPKTSDEVLIALKKCGLLNTVKRVKDLL